MNNEKIHHASDQYLPTLNGMGYMSPSLDIIQATFVEDCNSDGLFLDIGCGFGVATLPVVEKQCHITACDLEKKHLDFLKEHVPLEKRSFLTLVKGHFPDQVQFPPNTFKAINFSMVLHFLSFEAIEKAFKALFLSLIPGGKLYLTTSSPYQGPLTRFAPLYDKRRKVMEWPGYIPNIAEYVPERAHSLPKENIVFCIYELERLATKFGFQVIESTFFTRDEIPQDLKLDGREYSGIICEKPRDVSSLFLEKKRERNPTQAATIR
jgi:SAM-dependent methyltransferase